MDKLDVPQLQKNKKWPQYLATLSCVITMFTVGIHTGWPSPSFPILLSEDHPLHLTYDDTSYLALMSTAGDVVGSIIFPILADLIGRKLTILLTAVPEISAMLMIYFSTDSVALLYCARLIGGISESGCLSVLPLYIGEIAEARIRGTLLSLVTFFWIFGTLFIDIVGSYNTIETTSLIGLFFPALFLCTFSFMPESPYFYLMKNKKEDACKALTRLRKSDSIDEEMLELMHDVERQMSETGRFKDLIVIKSNRDALILAFILSLIYHLSGIVPLTIYAQVFFMEATDVIPTNWASSLMIFIALISTAISYSMVDRFGRRVLLLYTTLVCALSLTLLCVYFFLVDYSSLVMNNLNWLPLVLMIGYSITFNLGLSNIINCFLGEIFSASVKTKSAGIANIVLSLFAAGTAKMYQTLSDNYGLGAPLAIFAVSQLLGWIYCYRFLPETSGKTLEEIQQEIKGNKRV